MRRTRAERKRYAGKRLSLAIDRLIKGQSDQVKWSAKAWAKLWAKAAGVVPKP